MTHYKITNLTNTVGKRDLKYNTTLGIDYVDAMQKKKIEIKPGETVYLTIASLPLSVHKLRVNKLISVIEISDTELRNMSKPAIQMVAPKAVPVKENEDEIISLPKKKIKKSHDDDSSEN